MAPDENCEECGGLGYYTIPAHQRGGDIVDEQEIKCHCTKHEQDEDDETYDRSYDNFNG